MFDASDGDISAEWILAESAEQREEAFIARPEVWRLGSLALSELAVPALENAVLAVLTTDESRDLETFSRVANRLLKLDAKAKPGAEAVKTSVRAWMSAHWRKYMRCLKRRRMRSSTGSY